MNEQIRAAAICERLTDEIVDRYTDSLMPLPTYSEIESIIARHMQPWVDAAGKLEDELMASTCVLAGAQIAFKQRKYNERALAAYRALAQPESADMIEGGDE